MKVKIAFYKKSKTIFWKAIVWLQRKIWMPERYARYSHVEIVFRNRTYWIDDIMNQDQVEEYGLSFSSSEQDSGCRFNGIKWNSENWDFCEIDVTDIQYGKMLNFCKTQNGNKYWKVAIIFAQIFNFNCKKPWTWFCSEIVTRTLQEAGMCCCLNALFTKPWELALELESKGYIIK